MTTTTTKDYYLQLVAQKSGACNFKNKEVMIILMILQTCYGEGREEREVGQNNFLWFGIRYATLCMLLTFSPQTIKY